MFNFRSRSSINFRSLIALLLAAALIATSCGNSGDDDSAPETSAPENSAAETSAAETSAAETSAAETSAAETSEGTSDATDDATDESSPGEIDLGEFQSIEGVPGVTDDAISFAVTGTGPANPLGYCLLACFEAGVRAYFEYRNSIGGVHGRDLEIGRVDDDEFANTQITLLELIDDPDTFGIFSAPLTYPGFADVNEAGVPLYTTFPASPDSNGLESIFVPAGTNCLDCPTPSTVMGASLVGSTKIAALGFGVSQASKDCANRVEAEVAIFGPGKGIEFAYLNNELAFGFPNGVGPEVTAMKDAGVDYIATCIDATSAVTLEQELLRQDMADVVVVLPQGYGDTEFLAANADLLEGDVIGLPYLPVEADPGDSLLPTMTEFFDKAGVQANDYSIQGWMGADLAVTGLLAAGPQFDRAGVISATNQITNYTAGGLHPPVDWTKGHTAPGPEDPTRWCSTYLRMVDGTLELIADPAEPFYCWDLPLDEWVEPETSR